MAKSRPSGRSQGPRRRRGSEKTILNGTQVPRSKRKSQTTLSPAALLAQATALLQTGQPDAALPIAQRALALLQPASTTPISASLPALILLGEIYLELGDSESATSTFLAAVSLDPDGSIPESEGGGSEKFLWLAQLCEEGGEESIQWFEKGVKVLENDIEELDSTAQEGTREAERISLLEEKKRKLAAALCGMVEVWMTDLSLSPLAETTCTALITRALAASPNPSTLQTHASLLISQSDLPSACASLTRSLALWQHLPSDHPDIPDFATRISLARLLMEAKMEAQAMGVLEGLVAIEDGSVEGWYLGGWCALLMAGKGREIIDGKDSEDNQAQEQEMQDSTGIANCEIGNDDEGPEAEEERRALLVTSREWLQNSLRLYEMQDYEDERLRDHAVELVAELDAELGGIGADEEDGVGEEWEDEAEDEEKRIEDEDYEMDGT